MRSITDVLIEFPNSLKVALLAGPAPGAPAEAFVVEPVDAADPAEREQALAEARQAGMDEARAAAERVCADNLATLASEHRQALDQARAAWASSEGAALAEQMRSGLAALERRIASALAAVMMPVLALAVRARAGEAMAGAVADLLGGHHGGLIAVSGPADLVAPIRAAFAGEAAVAVSDADTPDVWIQAGDTVVATQIEAWTSRLRAAVEMPA